MSKGSVEVDYTKYLGKVCRFWNGDNPKLFKNIGILVGIDPEPRPFQCALKPKKRFEHCEPVRPDSDFIYKGE